MTTQEIRNMIANSREPNWFNSINLTIEYRHIEFKQTFTGFSTIHKFVANQIAGWEKYESIPTVLNSSKQHFTQLKTRLDNFITTHQSQTEGNLQNHWNSEIGQLKINNNFFTYDSAHTAFLINIHINMPESINGAFNYLIGTNQNYTDKNTFIGSVLAYEFDLKEKNGITERRKKETSTFSKIKNDLRGQLSESETQLTEHLINAKKDYDEYTKQLDDLKTEKEDLFNNWYDGTEDVIGVKKKIADLEYTYEELLRLKKPAEYWKARAEKLKSEGWKSMYWLIALVVFACFTLYSLLWLTPEGMLLSFIKGNAQAIKWSVIYVTFISFLAYGIRILHKVAFSSFHLARDSEEREQLTYVYLALIKDKAVDEKDKNLIMQSLFSRADTGLLNDDSGPTMPNDMAGKFFGK